MPLSPMMQQYVDTKEKYKDAILFFRVGDFYEIYFEDAKTASSELDIHLTGRDCGLEKRVEMAGVPWHAAEIYIAKLVEKGYKVAVCDQVAAPTNPSAKGALFKREITRVVTPGTLIDSPLLIDEKNNYIACVYLDNDKVGVAWSDISTGEFNHTEIEAPFAVALGELLTRISPSEIICNSAMLAASINLSIVKYQMVCPFSLHDEPSFLFENAALKITNHFSVDTIKQIKKTPLAVNAAGALLDYIENTQKRTLAHISNSKVADKSASMYIDYNARRHLELTMNLSDNSKKGSLLWLIDKTLTKPGARLLRHSLLEPTIDEKLINEKLDAVQELINSPILIDKISVWLSEVVDIERIVSKISTGSISPRDVLKLGQSLRVVPEIKNLLATAKTKMFAKISEKLIDLPKIYTEIMSGISQNAPLFARDGGVFNTGYSKELDEYTEIRSSTSEVISNLEAAERAETKIKTLKVSFTKNFGYYIELTRMQAEAAPFRYIRRQTLKNTERFTTEELKLLEEKILNADSKSLELEVQLYKDLVERLSEHIKVFLSVSKSLSVLDVLVCFSKVSRENNFVRPEINNKIDDMAIVDGRHPVVEKLLKGEQFMPNDTQIDSSGNRIMLITGPNMAGKSIYMRQVAIISILAHMGCFVPAKVARISITDKIFTRVGAGDDLIGGRSTFMVEMSEVANILENLSDRSLCLMDEIGRGTATYDGLSLAWAILEFLSKSTKAKILFSTHYHELTELEGRIDGLKNYKLGVKEIAGTIVFLRKIMRGKSNRSFGIEVAKLAGLPSDILDRSKQILANLEKSSTKINPNAIVATQSSFLDSSKATNEIVSILKDLDLDSVSFRHAHEILSDLKEKLEK